MWERSHTDLLSGKSMFIDMHDIDSPDKSAFCSTVYRHKYTCSGRHKKLSTTLGLPGVEPRKELV